LWCLLHGRRLWLHENRQTRFRKPHPAVAESCLYGIPHRHDPGLLFTLFGIWLESPLLISLPAVGILLPQTLWCADFVVHLSGGKLTGMTDYMFDAHRSLFLRGLSFFHGWLPFLLVYLLACLGYDRRALFGWTAICVVLCLICYFLLPAAGAELANPQIPRNVNYVFGMDDAVPQSLLPPLAYLGVWTVALVSLVFIPTHFVLKKICKPAFKGEPS
jgi:hypothetical protein